RRAAAGSRRRRRIPLVLGGAFVFVMANIGAVVDAFHHPEIPYLDQEHLIVGGITAFISAALLAGLDYHLGNLALAEKRIEQLEALTAICMYCKKVRPASVPSERLESWQPIESFVLRRFDVRFSHGMCPACLERHHPET
ncbi:MAG: hypothetical protein NUW21_07550, partial [Elusimicrobia bacterium]|nr:hypothetical protein [Elusimicrobiota bacterium]